MATSTVVVEPAFPPIVVWEWFNDHGRWRPYEPIIVLELEKRFLKGGNFTLGDVESKLSCYVVSFSSMQQISKTTNTARSVRRQIYPAESAPAKGVLWQWIGDVPGSWNTYDLDICCILETAFEKKQEQINLTQTACGLPYIIDLTNMIQIRNGTGFTREIRRIQMSVGYPVADDNDPHSTSNNNPDRKLKHSISAPCGVGDSPLSGIKSKIGRSSSTKLSPSDSKPSLSDVGSVSSISSTDMNNVTPSTSGIVSPNSDSGIVASASNSSVGMVTASPLPSSSGSSSSALSSSSAMTMSVPVSRMV
uniref:E3 ubiquitin-protein ligase n=1 Tax=Saccoglossus kowalevskii TaxID=10224 RepID=A0ABM0MAZ1_SACKO